MADAAASLPDDPTFDPGRFPRRLNLGCGFDRREGYLNVDFQPFHQPDLVSDVRKLDALPSAAYEEIVAQDVLEHLPRTDTLDTLREWARVLRPGGRLVLRVPDVIGLARLLANRRDLAEQEVLLQNLFGTQAYPGDFHHFGFTELVLRHYLAAAGFRVDELSHRDEWLFDVVAVRVEGEAPPPPTDLPYMRLEGGGEGDPAPGPPAQVDVVLARVAEALARAAALTDPAPGDLTGTRLRGAKAVLLRVARLVTHRQRAHNQAVQDALRALADALR
jgi:predicted SAM-dependent methyltransferase